MSSLSIHTSNPHFARLFAAADKPCAIQLWGLVVEESTTKKVKRVVYGRVMPYNFANHRWGFSQNDKTQNVDGARAKITRLSLFTSSRNVKAFFEALCGGLTLDAINQQLELDTPENFSQQFGDLALDPAELIFQPTEYLFNRSAYEQGVLHSPHESAGALSAAIVQTNKLHLISESSNQKNSLLSHIAKTLNAETGLDFLGSDQERLGNIEFLVFPSLDDKERAKLLINHQREQQAIKLELAEENQETASYQFLIKLFNRQKLIYSALQMASYCKTKQAYIAEFSLDAITNEVYDCIEVEVYINNAEEGFMLQDRMRMLYMREINLNMHIIGAEQQPVKLDWLEDKVPSKHSNRAQALLVPNKSKPETITINRRENEQWVALNQQFGEKLKLLNPQPSKGQFFLRYGLSQGEGALEFVEWIKKLFNQYQSHHIAIFDPYFETLGISLIKLYASPEGSYSAFTTYPKTDKPSQDKTRYDNLLKACEKNRKSLSKLNLTIYGLKQDKLHDRYILVLNNAGIPVQGFHLSNSLQSATANHPLLITPIPQDVLLSVSTYMQGLIQASNNTQNIKAGIKILFDSQQRVTENLEQPQRKDKKLNDDVREAVMSPIEIMNWVNTVNEQSQFKTEWQKVATSLAHTYSDTFTLPDKLPNRFLEQLEVFLKKAVQQPETEHETTLSVIEPSFYSTNMDELLSLNIEMALRFPYGKASNLNWAEYYAINLLWQHKPKVLFDLITAAGKENLPKDFRIEASNAKYYSLLSQTLSEMHLTTILAPTEKLAQQLLTTDNAVLRWFGLNMFNQLAIKNDNPDVFFKAIKELAESEQTTFSGWFLLQQREQTSENYLKTSINKFLQRMPSTLNKQDLKAVLNSLRGRMKSLAHNGAWIHENILEPLLKQDRVCIDDVALFWFKDFKSALPLCNSTNSTLFSSEYEGRLTNLAAYFYAFASAKQQAKLLDEIKDLLSQAQRTVNQPLASTINYEQWNAALHTALWLDAFMNLAKFYHLRAEIEITPLLESRQAELTQIIQLRSEAEWQQFANEMVAFHTETKAMLLQHE